MNRFIKTLIIVFASTFVLLVAYKAPRIITMRNSEFKINPSYKTIVIGSSLGTAGINDSILNNWKNLCMSGSNYTHSVVFLRKILNDNNQIDSVIILCSPQSFMLYADNSLNEQGIQTFKEFDYFYSNYKKEDLKYVANNPNFYGSFFCNNLFSSLKAPTEPNSYGFSYVTKNNLNNANENWGIKWYDEYVAKADDKVVSLDVIKTKRTIQKTAFERMLQLCKEKNKTIVLLSTPLYNYERWFSCDGFIDYLGTLDKSIQFADYQHFELPDTTYYKDVHHLNGKGAHYFSTYIKEHGLKAQCLGDYVKEKKANRKNS